MPSTLPNLSRLPANLGVQPYQGATYQETLNGLRQTLAGWVGPIDEAYNELYNEYAGTEIVTEAERLYWRGRFEIFKKLKETLEAVDDTLTIRERAGGIFSAGFVQEGNFKGYLKEFNNSYRSILVHLADILFRVNNMTSLPPDAIKRTLDEIIP